MLNFFCFVIFMWHTVFFVWKLLESLNLCPHTCAKEKTFCGWQAAPLTPLTNTSNHFLFPASLCCSHCLCWRGWFWPTLLLCFPFRFSRVFPAHPTRLSRSRFSTTKSKCIQGRRGKTSPKETNETWAKCAACWEVGKSAKIKWKCSENPSDYAKKNFHQTSQKRWKIFHRPQIKISPVCMKKKNPHSNLYPKDLKKDWNVTVSLPLFSHFKRGKRDFQTKTLNKKISMENLEKAQSIQDLLKDLWAYTQKREAPAAHTKFAKKVENCFRSEVGGGRRGGEERWPAGGWK